MRAVEAGSTVEELELLSLPDNADVAQEFRDRSTGLPLNLEMIKKARELEMLFMEELRVLEDSDREACMAETGRPPRKVVVCSPLTSTCGPVPSRSRGKATCGDWAPHPVVVCFGERSRTRTFTTWEVALSLSR